MAEYAPTSQCRAFGLSDKSHPGLQRPGKYPPPSLTPSGRASNHYPKAGDMTQYELDALANMSEAEIRRAQDLVRAQQALAYEQRNERAMDILNQYEDAYADEMMRRLMG